MRRPRIFWRLFPSYAVITVAALLLTALYVRHVLDNFYLDETATDLLARAELFAERIDGLLQNVENSASEIDVLAKQLGEETETRITVILPTGKVIADTDEDPAVMDNHRGRPEIATALAKKEPGRSERFSDTLHEEFMYRALPLFRNGEPLAVVRTSMPLTSINETLEVMEQRVLLVAVIASVLTVIVSWIIARRISRPLEAMTAGAERFAQGELDHRLRIDGSFEVASLATAMNEMASELHERIETVERQRNERGAMVASMVEGVLALDEEGAIISINEAAGRMLQVNPDELRGRVIHEAIRKADLLQFVDRVRTGPGPVVEDIVIHGDEDVYLEVHGTILCDAHGKSIGVLIVLHDVTRLRHLETMRREFVANVSHELRTPITSIKGFAETLLDGALKDEENAERFVQTILKQADRLIAVIGDIFALSQIERDSGAAGIDLAPGSISELLDSAVQMCQGKAADKEIQLQLDFESDLRANVNGRLLEQAIMNLIDNAIKFSPAGSLVQIDARREGSQVCISVADEGCGIDTKHLPRLFERFYRVDKARSRELGGTGLGLSIVKHVALAHGGSVAAESRLGKGSTFRIRIPALDE